MARDIRQFYPGSDDHPVDEAERANGLTGDGFGDSPHQVADWAQGGNNFSTTTTTLTLPGEQGEWTPSGAGITPETADTRYVRYDQAQEIMDTTQVFSNLGLGSAASQPSTAFAAASHRHTASEITDFDAEVANNTAVAANTAKVSFPGFGTTGTTALRGDARTIQPAEVAKLAGVQDNAEQNVQADWDETDSNEDSFIQNKPITITTDQAQAITDNTAKVGITTAQAQAITDNTGSRHNAVSLTGENYLSLSGQQITANEVNLTTNVTGQLPVANINTAQLNSLIDQRASAIGSVHRFADMAAFQANTITWHVGDILIIGDTTYLFIGTEGTSTNLSDFQQITVSGGGISQATADGRYAPLNHTHTVSQITDFATGVSTNTAVAANTAKVGITTTQAADIVRNNAKVSYPSADQTKLAGIAAGAEVNVQADWNETDNSEDSFIQNKPTTITTAQAQAITANTAKVGITPQQAADIVTNNAKVGITTAQAGAITANTAKVSFPGFGTTNALAARGDHEHDDRYVRYDASQTLTEPQRTQFFNNVGAFSGLAFGGLMTQDFTAQGQNIYVLDNIPADRTMTLPAGAVGMEIRIQNLSTFQAGNPSESRSSSTWRIVPNTGERIATLPVNEELVLDVARASFHLTYTGTAAGWIITGTE